MEMSPSSPTTNDQMQQQEVSRLLISIQQAKKHLKMVYGEDYFAQLKMNTEGDIDAAATRLSLISQMVKLARQRTMLGKLVLRENSVNVNDQQQQYQQYPQHQILNQQPKQLNTMPKSSSYNHERLELQPAASPQVQPNTIEHQQQHQQHPHHEILNQQQKLSHMVPMPNLSSYNHQLQGHVDIQSATSPQVQQITMEQQQQMQSHLWQQLKQQQQKRQQHPQPQKQQMRQQHPQPRQRHPQPVQQQILQQHVQPQKHQNQQHPQPQQQQILQQHPQTQQQLKRKQHPQPQQQQILQQHPQTHQHLKRKHPQPEQQQILQQHPQTQQQLKQQQHPQPQQLLKLQQHSHPQQQFKRQQHPQTQQQQIRQQYPHPQQLQKQQQHPQLWRPTNNSSSYNYQRQTHVDPQSAASLQIQQNTMERQQQQQQQQHPQPVISVPNSSSYNYQRQQQVDLHSAALPQVQENTMGQQQMQSQLQNRIVFKRIPLCSSPDFIAYERVTPGECSSQGNVATNQSLGKRKDHNFISQNVQDQVVSERLYINPQLAALTQNEQLVMIQKQADLQQQQTDLQQLFVTSPKVQKNTMDFNLQEFSEPVQQQHRQHTQQQQQQQQQKESSMMQMHTVQKTICSTESQPDATATITGGISSQDYGVTNPFLGKRKNQDFVSQNLQAQEISKELHINPQLSVLTQNEQPVVMQNSIEKQPLLKQISEVSLPDTSSQQRREQQQADLQQLNVDLQHQLATSPQLEDDTTNFNLQEFSELLLQQQQPTQILDQQLSPLIEMPSVYIEGFTL